MNGERERRLREEMDEEIRFHLEMRERELIARGVDVHTARARARKQFGAAERAREACVRLDLRREARMTKREVWSDLARDTRIGLRQLRRRPVFALVAVATLSIGIGANTAIFSAVDHVLLRPLPYAEPERVVTLWESDRTSGETQRQVSPGNFNEWVARASAFEALGLAEPTGYTLTGVVPPEAVQSWGVTEGWLEALGLRPALGRDFTPEEHAAGRMSAVLISHDFWVSRYAGDPGVVGSTIELEGTAVPIVGVLPRGLEYPEPKPLWSPKTWYASPGFDERTDRESAYMLAVGRIRAGIAREDAAADLEKVAGELARAFPETNTGVGTTLVPLRDHVLGDVRPALLVLLGTVGFVLLIACANVTSLLLVRAAERGRELGVRSALGAERGRLVLQLLTESVVLGVLGGLGGLLVAWLGIQWFASAAPPELPRADEIALDGRILAFSAALTLLTTLLFGLIPALRSSRGAVLASGGSDGRSTSGQHTSLLHGGLVVSEVALALVLLIGAGLLGRSFLSLTANEVGFTTEGRVAIQLFLWDRHPTAAQREEAVRRLEEALEAVPNVSEVALVTALPFHPEQIDAQSVFQIEDLPQPEAGQRPSAYTLIASPDYFDVMGIPILRGRGFTPDDRMDAARVILVNETVAARFFPGEDPVGRRLVIGAMDRSVAREIVGVVRNVRPTAYDSDPRAEVYFPFAQSLNGSVTLVAAVQGSSAAALPALRQVVVDFDAEQPIYNAHTVEELIRTSLATRRFSLLGLASLSTVALLLAIGGVYGLLSYATASRTAEIGIRMAMGARGRDVEAMIVRQGLTLALTGVVLGLGAAALLTRFMAGMLYRVEPVDPATFAQVALLMAVVSALAAWLPARRASRYHPARALRS